MTNNQNIETDQLATIEALTMEQLQTVRRNIQAREYTDEQTRDAVAEYVADGGEIKDLLADTLHAPDEAPFRAGQTVKMNQAFLDTLTAEDRTNESGRTYVVKECRPNSIRPTSYVVVFRGRDGRDVDAEWVELVAEGAK